MTLGRKQATTHEEFVAALRSVPLRASAADAERWVNEAAEDIRRTWLGKRVALAWSGGKDSQALRIVCDRAGVHRSVLGLSRLEYPEFLAWATRNMPDGLTVWNTGQDLDWLAANPGMLFPKDSKTAGKWFKIVQHTAQAGYFMAENLDALLLGRRRKDGNFVGRNGECIYTSKGITRHSPIADWTHEQVLAVLHYFGGGEVALAPCYRWPRGFRVGTGPWPARQWTVDEAHGWREVFAIDPSVVEEAARYFPGAAAQIAAQR